MAESQLCWGCRIYWLHLCKGVRPPPTHNRCLGYDTIPSKDDGPVLELSETQSTSLLLLPGPLWPRVVVPVRVPSMSQIELFKTLLYLEPFNCEWKMLNTIISNCIWWWGFSLGVWRMCTPSLLLFTGTLWPRLVVPVMVPSMGQIELFNLLQGILSILNSNTWNHLTQRKQMINITKNY